MNQANITAEGCPVTEAELEAIARYSRRRLTAEEVYTFPLVLCDNDLDRDHECFTDAALEKLAVLFRGKTGIFDHDPRGEKQTARIYRCAVEEEPGRLNHRGEPYKALRAWAYMVRTAANADLILEIDGGIKKEVSVGCSIGKKVCSICGADRQEATCGHQPGKKYGGRLCYTLLEDPTDAYEWSFVAVPAQPAAGVTKSHAARKALHLTPERAIAEMERGELHLDAAAAYGLRKHIAALEEKSEEAGRYRQSLCETIRRRTMLAQPQMPPALLEKSMAPLTVTELGSLDAFQRQLKRFDIQVGGSHSSALEKFFQNGQSAVLFPEYLMRAIRQGMEENDPLSSIVAARTLISATDYRGLTTNDDLEADVTNEAAALSTTTISLKDKTTALKKRGRMLRASYEAIKFQRLDLFTLALRRIGAEIARCQMKDAVDVLVNGDGSTGSAPQKLTTAATTLAYSDLLTLWSKFTAYQMNTLLVNAKTAAAILGLSAFSDPTTGLHFQNTGKLGTPLGAERILCDAVADGTIIALDRRYALEMVVGDAVTVDADRLIDCQLERAAVSSTAGFSMIFPDAVKVMTLKTA